MMKFLMMKVDKAQEEQSDIQQQIYGKWTVCMLKIARYKDDLKETHPAQSKGELVQNSYSSTPGRGSIAQQVMIKQYKPRSEVEMEVFKDTFFWVLSS